MKLLVDVGNSRVKWAFCTTDSFVSHGEALLDDGPGLRPLFESNFVPEEIRIANVAGTAAGSRIAASLQERFRIAPVFASAAATGAGVRNGYTAPAQLGVDRWLAICAAYARYCAPICVADAGTATTIDMVAGGGEHEGGLILPGIELMQLALFRGTSDLARLSGTNDGLSGGQLPDSSEADAILHPLALGRNTATAIRYGAIQATASLIRACIARFAGGRPPPEPPPVLVLTGGGALALQACLLSWDMGTHGELSPHFLVEYRPYLVLEGLALDPICFGVVR